MPKTIKIGDEDYQTIMTETGKFKEGLVSGLVSSQVFMNLQTFQYKDALLAIAKRANEVEMVLNKMIYARDAGKVLILRSTTEINQSIIKNHSFEEGILPHIKNIAYGFREIYQNLDDLHYSQVCINLRGTCDILKQKIAKNESESKPKSL